MASTAFLSPAAADSGLSLCLAAYMLYGAAALTHALWRADARRGTADFLLTARHSQSAAWAAASWFATGVGAWTLFGPAALVADPAAGAGLVGLLTHAAASGAPLVMVARIGAKVRVNVPQATSVASYALWRFGRPVQVFVLALVVFCLVLGLLSEYLVVGVVFNAFLGCSPIVPILVVGIITMAYTFAGGLYVSILTDAYQTCLVLLLVLISLIWLIQSYSGTQLPPLPSYLGATSTGWSTLATIGIPLTCGSFFQEALWQRCWSSETEYSLKMGSLYGGLLTSFVVAFLGFGGMLAYWSGKASDTLNSNSSYAFVYAFADSSSGTVPTAIVLIILVFTTVMNESAVDSFQNAITDSIATLCIACGYRLKPVHVRCLVLLLNIPIMILAVIFASFNVSILNAFGLSNMVVTMTFAPIAAGLIPSLNSYLTAHSAMGACLASFLVTIAYGAAAYGSLGAGMKALFWTPKFDAVGFLIAFLSSIGFIPICIGAEILYRKYRNLHSIPPFVPPVIPSLIINDSRVVFAAPQPRQSRIKS
ncbi:hypothetical protein BDR26DRAFT_1002604 [Obelidium mucronatum]|nr:hypothetical protein BDR26DRAFT_1002604 [Obelidium mucronatum]